MKHFSKLLVSAFAAFSMVACSEDLPEGGNNNFYPEVKTTRLIFRLMLSSPLLSAAVVIQLKVATVAKVILALR